MLAMSSAPSTRQPPSPAKTMSVVAERALGNTVQQSWRRSSAAAHSAALLRPVSQPRTVA